MTVAFQWQFGSGVPPAAVVGPDLPAAPVTWTTPPSAADPATEDMSTVDERGHDGIESTELDRVARPAPPVRRDALAAQAGGSAAPVRLAGAQSCSEDLRTTRVSRAGADQVSGAVSVFGSKLVSLTTIVGKLDLAMAGGGDTGREPITCILSCGIGN